MRVRLNRYLAQCGVCSRRHADSFILDGRVEVNDEIVTTLGFIVDTDRDDVCVDSERLHVPKRRVLMLNKPRGVLSTCKPDRERGPTVLEYIPQDKRYFPVGRLDKESSGLLLLTNDGDLALRLTHPRFGSHKTYQVRTAEPLSRTQLGKLLRGVMLDDGPAKALFAKQIGPELVEITLGEGRNRQLRRMIAALGNRVVELVRVEQSGLKLGHLPEGRWRELKPSEINSLLASTELSNSTE
jgi:23S rRNA pseudouridine2605 synthase